MCNCVTHMMLNLLIFPIEVTEEKKINGVDSISRALVNYADYL